MSKINNNRDSISNITTIITIRTAILMIGTMNSIMLIMISNTIVLINQPQVKEKSTKPLKQKKTPISFKHRNQHCPKNKNKRVIRKTKKSSLKLKRKLLTKRKKKKVHLLMKNTKLNKDNSMFKMSKMKI